MSHSSLFRRAAKTCGLAAVATLCLTLAGCGSTIKTSPTVHNAVVNRETVHESEHVTKGQTLTVRLPTDGGTMFLWRMTGDSFKNGMLELVRRQDQLNSYGQIASRGEPAWDVFTFRANRTGQASVAFAYEHRYSVNDPIRRYSLDVDVITPEMAQATASAQ